MKSILAISAVTLVSALGFAGSAQAQNCSGHNVKVHVIPGTAEIKVTPTVFKEKKGCGFEIIVPDGMETSIISASPWLNGSAAGGSIYIDIPEDEANGDYKYDVDIVGVGRLDPHIRVF